HRNQRQRLRALLHDLSVQPIPVMYERDFFLEVLDWLTKYADHEPDWADACVAILSGRDKDLKIWTYDREFRTTWRRPDGTAVPRQSRSHVQRRLRRCRPPRPSTLCQSQRSYNPVRTGHQNEPGRCSVRWRSLSTNAAVSDRRRAQRRGVSVARIHRKGDSDG